MKKRQAQTYAREALEWLQHGDTLSAAEALGDALGIRGGAAWFTGESVGEGSSRRDLLLAVAKEAQAVVESFEGTVFEMDRLRAALRALGAG